MHDLEADHWPAIGRFGKTLDVRRKAAMFEGKAVQALADRVEQLAEELRATQARCDHLEQALSQREAESGQMRDDLERALSQQEAEFGRMRDHFEQALSQREAEFGRMRDDQRLLGRRLDETETQSGKAMTGLFERIEQLRGRNAATTRHPT